MEIVCCYGENEHSVPVQNDLLQLFAIPAKWFILANFCFMCKTYILKEVTVFLILIMVVFPNNLSSEKSWVLLRTAVFEAT